MRKVVVVLSLAMTAGMAIGQDRDGSDHPLVPRYPKSFIETYRAPSLDEIVMPTGPIAKEDGDTNRQKLEGRVTHIDYRLKPSTATLQIETYYHDVLKNAGFKEVYSCHGDACGGDMASLILNSGKIAPTGLASSPFNDTMRVLIARKGDTWVLLHTATDRESTMIYEAVVESAKL